MADLLRSDDSSHHQISVSQFNALPRKMNFSISSPNDWLEKAGAHVNVAGSLVLPLKCLLVPMGLASESIVSFRKAESLSERIKFGLVVVMLVRVADTAYFIAVAKHLKEGNPNGPKVCQHCLRGQLWPTKMKEYRKGANRDIIHKMENEMLIGDKDLEVVELYYKEMFEHPLCSPLSWSTQAGIKMCPGCLKKNGKSSSK